MQCWKTDVRHADREIFMVRPDSQRGKRTSSKAGREGRFVLAASSTLMFAIASINAAMAAPTGAQFNPNEIKISQQGKTTLIDQSTQRAIINWKASTSPPTRRCASTSPA